MPNGSTGDALASAARTLRAKAIRRRALKRVSDLLGSQGMYDVAMRRVVLAAVEPIARGARALELTVRSIERQMQSAARRQ